MFPATKGMVRDELNSHVRLFLVQGKQIQRLAESSLTVQDAPLPMYSQHEMGKPYSDDGRAVRLLRHE